MPPKGKKKNSMKKRRQSRVSRLGKSFVTTYEPSISFTKRIRYYASNTQLSSGIIVNDLLDTLCLMTAANAAYRLCSAVRMIALKATVLPTFSNTADTTNTPVMIQVYTSSASLMGGPVRVHTLNNYGTVPASCVIPLEGALASNWFNAGNTGTTKLFDITVSTTAALYLDVSFEFVLQNCFGAVQSVSAVTQSVGGTTGQVGICPLDGNSNGFLLPYFYIAP